MQTKTKQRLVGLLILLAILAIFIPLVFHNSRSSTEMKAIKVPPKPKIDTAHNALAREPQPKGASFPRSGNTLPPKAALESAEPQTQMAKHASDTPKAMKSVVVKAKAHMKKDKARALSAQKGLANFMEEPKAWCVQLGTFRNVNNANALIKKLRKKGYDAYTRPVLDANGKHLLRVYVGPEIRKESALQLKDKLKMSVHLNGVVRQYRVKT